MNRTFTQKELGDYLNNNPLGAVVHFGDLDNMNGENYIFVDYLGERLIPFDNGGDYITSLQVSIYVKDFASRKILVDYVKQLSQFNIEYQGSDEGNYFVSILTTTIFLK